MRLHAYLAQGLNPGQTSLRYAQLPGISESESEELVQKYPLLADLIFSLEEKADDRVREVKKVASKWGKLDLVDASFRGSYPRSLPIFARTDAHIQSLMIALSPHPPLCTSSSKYAWFHQQAHQCRMPPRTMRNAITSSYLARRTQKIFLRQHLSALLPMRHIGQRYVLLIPGHLTTRLILTLRTASHLGGLS